eukprot:CAMPEP_0184323454 /NCGR_PEP_ID=MMETSP1049-20130417/130463_1 /TAXON_ID=77928 /ORGANISM="Proteomonas sulcata, Strain CCMP704" /LENGTH=86 /DNA_ID=CAMNT_0026644967 /DNA_START=77 /DNA_END=337 /DNA_ORIENTATION=+
MGARLGHLKGSRDPIEPSFVPQDLIGAIRGTFPADRHDMGYDPWHKCLFLTRKPFLEQQVVVQRLRATCGVGYEFLQPLSNPPPCA